MDDVAQNLPGKDTGFDTVAGLYTLKSVGCCWLGGTADGWGTWDDEDADIVIVGQVGKKKEEGSDKTTAIHIR